MNLLAYEMLDGNDFYEQRPLFAKRAWDKMKYYNFVWN